MDRKLCTSAYGAWSLRLLEYSKPAMHGAHTMMDMSLLRDRENGFFCWFWTQFGQIWMNTERFDRHADVFLFWRSLWQFFVSVLVGEVACRTWYEIMYRATGIVGKCYFDRWLNQELFISPPKKSSKLHVGVRALWKIIESCWAFLDPIFLLFENVSRVLSVKPLSL